MAGFQTKTAQLVILELTDLAELQSTHPLEAWANLTVVARRLVPEYGVFELSQILSIRLLSHDCGGASSCRNIATAGKCNWQNHRFGFADQQVFVKA